MKSILMTLLFSIPFFVQACPISSADLALKMMQSKNNKSLQHLMDQNLTEEEFNSTVKRIRDYFTPVFAAAGKSINVYSSWSFPMNNAFATQDKNGTSVYFFGLFTMNKFMTKDSFLFVACHEIGHHLGGFPKQTGSMSWASDEGQADYFAANKCYRELLKNDPENENADKLVLSDSVKELCKAQYPAEDEYRICLRSVRAGEDVGKMLDYMKTSVESKQVLLLEPEPAPATKTLVAHPDPICRTHGILSASLCNRPSDVAISDTDETVGVCHEKNGDKIGYRALCWFKPE
jgi:hypothetical protein